MNEEQLRAVTTKKITDREITNLLGYKEIKSIRTWSISTHAKKEEKEIELFRIWCKKLGAICLLADISQKDIISLATDKFKNELDCSIPAEF